MRRACLALALLGWLVPALATAADGVARLEQFLGDLRSLAADFEQQLYDEYGDPLETSRGRVRLARPDRFAWEYLEPYRQTIVSDGRTLWIYDEDLAQVTVNEIDAESPATPARLLSGEVDLDAEYVTEELGEQAGLSWVKLTPRGDQQQYEGIEIGFATEGVAAMRLRDNLGQTTELRFSAVVRNEPISAETFVFEPPPGVDVVQGAAP